MLEKRIKKYYSGKKAVDYELVREKQETWHAENKIIPEIINKYIIDKESIIDLPCGPGRWIKEFNKLCLYSFMIDISDDMLTRAKLNASECKNAEFEFINMDIFADTTMLPNANCLIMTRFLNLISLSNFNIILDKAIKAGIRKYIFTARLRGGGESIADKILTHIYFALKNTATILNIRKKSFYHLYNNDAFYGLLHEKGLIVREVRIIQKIRNEKLVGIYLER